MELNPELCDAILKSSRIAIIAKNFDGTIISWNPAAEKLYQYEASEVIGKSIDIIIPEEKREELKATLNRIKNGEEVEDYQTIRKTKQGHLINVVVIICPLKDNNGKLVGAISLHGDITEHKYSEIFSEKKSAKERFRKILEATPDAMVIINQEGKINFINTQTEKLFGYQKNELYGQNVDILIPEPYRSRHPQHRFNYFEAPRVRPMGIGMELYGMSKDGKIFPVEISLSPLQVEEGLMAVAAIRDITIRKQTEEKMKELITSLERSNTELERFAHIASHDLQEPLRMVASYTQLLQRKYKKKLDSEANEYINYAVDGALRMQQLIIDLMAYSRVATKGKPFELVDLNSIAKEAIHNLQVAIKDAKASVTYDALPTVIGDDTQLLQVFQNLISNAVKFKSDKQPTVHISAQKNENMWQLSIKDNGIGISPEYHDQIFLIFQRLHSKNEYPGTGVGLAICKKIIERHRGQIWVKSELNKGAEFCIKLPV